MSKVDLRSESLDNDDTPNMYSKTWFGTVENGGNLVDTNSFSRSSQDGTDGADAMITSIKRIVEFSGDTAR